MSYLIVYDIKRLDNAMRLRVNRHLRKLGALRLQHSVWELNKFDHLLELAVSIKSVGGKAIIVKKHVLYE
jgi:CRISPR-associated endonuclease Cas2